MVFGVLAGLGAIIGGVGIFRGSSKVGKAAESTADHTGRALESITNDVKELKTYIVKEIGPQINETLLRFQQVLDRFEELVITGTVATKILALTLLLCAILICKYIASEIERDCVRSKGFQRRRSVALKPEQIIVCLLYYICLFMAIVMAFHLVTEVTQMTWPKHFPIIIIIPSIATLSMCLQHIVGIFKAIWKLIKQLIYCVFGLPINLFRNPLTSGFTYYSNSSVPVSIAVAFVILPLYSFALAFLLGAVEYYLKRKVSPFQTVLASYVLFIITALAVYVIWMLFLRAFVRPMWAFTARRNYRSK